MCKLFDKQFKKLIMHGNNYCVRMVTSVHKQEKDALNLGLGIYHWQRGILQIIAPRI